MVNALYDTMIVNRKAVCCRNIEEVFTFFDLVKQMQNIHKNDIRKICDNSLVGASNEDFGRRYDEIRFIFYEGFLKFGRYRTEQPDINYFGVTYKSVVFSDLLEFQSECVDVSDEDISTFFF